LIVSIKVEIKSVYFNLVFQILKFDLDFNLSNTECY
jgi:hypothetical protein